MRRLSVPKAKHEPREAGRILTLLAKATGDNTAREPPRQPEWYLGS